MVTCLICYSPDIHEIVEDNKRRFYCKSCQKLYDRALDSRYGKDLVINTTEGRQHLSVGALIRRKDHRFLLIKRRSYPFGYDFPAGHVEYNEKPEQALAREVFEELGLKVKRNRLLLEGEMKGNKCKYGADNHFWYFYECECNPDTPFLNAESEDIGWYTRDEAKQLDLIPSAQFFLNQVVTDD